MRTADQFRSTWHAVRTSRFAPALVIVAILGIAAALFVGSYTYSTANPKPERVPIAVVGTLPGSQSAEVEVKLAHELGSSLDVRHVATDAEAFDQLQNQQVFAVVDIDVDTRTVDVAVSSASGATVAQLLEQATPQATAGLGYTVNVRDVNPLQPRDPHGLTIFYMMLAAVIIGFVGAIQLGVHANKLRPWERIGFTALYSLLGDFTICAMIDWIIGALTLPVLEVWLILALTMFTCGMIFTMFSSMFGRWAILPTWAVMVLLGNPSSGGSVAWPLLPRVIATIGGWLPPGASVNALHTAVYFRGHQHLWPFLVLVLWSVVSIAVYLFERRVRGHAPSRTAATADIGAA
ncbi:hypothetical protein [Gordonia otitidis]|uniref:DUF3533 domain-containing protein n=1 Tax=Gordonia otitidis (strain DSM 44809 / CCUG 52243 / JCM 12355 / NBRC 100426 / IFM 10032) TaxID=1108044 RepID=H5TS91_GORO1|nr:hypothetical protein [Gordonia otitidis]GAB36349.1 hypothetical protein GOOTI_211_00020 [Gordonia otitidis NBRC 100426]